MSTILEKVQKGVEIWKALPVFPRRTLFIFVMLVAVTFFGLQVYSIITTGDTMGIKLRELFLG